jgi:hypothetical protein
MVLLLLPIPELFVPVFNDPNALNRLKHRLRHEEALTVCRDIVTMAPPRDGRLAVKQRPRPTDQQRRRQLHRDRHDCAAPRIE